MARPSTAYTTIDFDRNGKHTGFFNIPHSPHDDAWGAVRLPICVIRNGEGPTAVLMAGNHGDEYEGPIALGELIRDLDPRVVSGRLIILPALNLPAVLAGQRTSPVDGLNLNRTFPGDPHGTLTQQITAYVTDVIYPLGDAMIDLHSGGSSLDIIPSAIVESASDPAHHARNVAAVRAFGAPLNVIIDNLGEPRTSTATAVRAGMTVVGTEMAGSGTVSTEALNICRRGVRNVLGHLGIIEAPANSGAAPERPMMRIPGPSGFVLATRNGVFEPFHAKGAEVRAGDKAGQIHDLGDPSRPPEALYFAADGMVYGRRQPGRVSAGNCCLVVACPAEVQP